jgi:8-oxo-dGTP pyrophosphatase MutT (NUDIX family)
MPLVLQPNAAVITNLRRKPVGDEDIASAKGHAAGTLYVAPDGAVLLLRRSPNEANFAGHWSLPGGGVEDGESPEDGARREAMEEMGPDIPQGKRKLIDQKVTPTGMVFHTFAQPVDEKFTPKLNGEHTGYDWAPLNALPSPMHPAVQDTLSNRVGVAQDMSPEDWQGMVGGLLKFLAEEAQEPEHAEDALALDRESIKMKDVDGRLHVADVPLCRESVDEYKGSEIPGCVRLGLDPEKIYRLWRPAEELQKALPTINGIPVLRKHVATSAADHKSSHTIGAVGTNARWEPPFIRGDIVIWPEADIKGIESKDKAALSPGYRYEPIMEVGDFAGQHYDGKMTKIVFNHEAVVENGRQAEVGIDSDDELRWAAVERALLAI